MSVAGTYIVKFRNFLMNASILVNRRLILIASTLAFSRINEAAYCIEDEIKDNSFNKKKVVMIKYGGSAITKKSEFETLHSSNLASLSEQIKEAKTYEHSPKLIVIHGAGSFGHFHAKSYELSSGGEINLWPFGVAVTRQSVLKLHNHVIDSLTKSNLPVVSMSLFPFFRKSNNEIIQEDSALFIRNIASLLSLGFIPVLHGDVILDDKLRCSIFSGDKILSWLTKNLKDDWKPASVVFITDVAGVYDRNPAKYPDAKLLRHLTVKLDGSIIFPEMECASHDVTGGIKTKIESAVEIAKEGIPVYIVQAGSRHVLTALLGMEPEVGTIISLETSLVCDDGKE